VQLLHYQQLEGGEPRVYPMLRGEQGAWSFPRPKEWAGQ
jgi:hypothetical protein